MRCLDDRGPGTPQALTEHDLGRVTKASLSLCFYIWKVKIITGLCPESRAAEGPVLGTLPLKFSQRNCLVIILDRAGLLSESILAHYFPEKKKTKHNTKP